jgi:hypothetical protein
LLRNHGLAGEKAEALVRELLGVLNHPSRGLSLLLAQAPRMAFTRLALEAFEARFRRFADHSIA